MKLYRGTDLIVDKPIIMEVNRPLDFGGGFYLASNYEQAKNGPYVLQQGTMSRLRM